MDIQYGSHSFCGIYAVLVYTMLFKIKYPRSIDFTLGDFTKLEIEEVAKYIIYRPANTQTRV